MSTTDSTARPGGADSPSEPAEGSALPGLRSLERYRPLVDDWEAFTAALARPLPVTIWTNRARIGPERLATLLEQEGAAPEPLGWCPGAFRLRQDAAPGRGLLGSAGVYHIQEEVSLLPVELLDPRPGERVLDLCAAPGGKTARIAVAMADRGTVVANDVDWRRLVAVGKNLDRLGLVNVVATAWDGAHYPEAAGPFDRVLADVPCTCEGTSRKNPGVLEWGGEEERRRTAGVQRAILGKAVRLCRGGGRIVYSTCTYAPEENEAVVDAVLREHRAAGTPLRLVERRVERFPAAPGLTAWEGRRFDPSLVRALRVWPHHHDTGGFFVAVLEKEEGGAPASPAPGDVHRFEEADRERWLSPVVERFGLPEAIFEGLCPILRGKSTIALVSHDLAAPAYPEPRAAGLPLLHAGMRDPKLTTAAAMAFGARATRNVIDLDRDLEWDLEWDGARDGESGQAEAYVARRDLDLTRADAAAMDGPGYAVVRWRGVALGVGWFRPAPGGGGSLRSLFPKRWD